MGKSHPTSQEALASNERAARIYKLRIQEGYTYRKIAEIEKCSIGTIHNALWKYLEENKPDKESIEHYRNEQIGQLTEQVQLMIITYRTAKAKELQALNPPGGQLPNPDTAHKYGRLADSHFQSILRCSERISKYLGLDAPIKLDINERTLEDHEIELQQIIREELARKALEAQPGTTDDLA